MIFILKSGVVLTISPVPGSWESVGVPHQTTLLHQRIKSQQPSSVQSALSDRVMPVTRYIREHILVIILQHFLSSKLILNSLPGNLDRATPVFDHFLQHGETKKRKSGKGGVKKKIFKKSLEFSRPMAVPPPLEVWNPNFFF